VPDLPPTSVNFTGTYAHILPWYQINSPKPSALTPTTPQDITSMQNDIPNSPDLTLLNVATRLPFHNYYINNISDCGETSVAEIVTASIPILTPLVKATIDKFPQLRDDPVFGPLITIAIGFFRIEYPEAEAVVRTAML
jgi:hypothetical protein